MKLVLAFALLAGLSAPAWAFDGPNLSNAYCQLTTFTSCKTDFSSVIGTANGVAAYSNCNEKCILPLNNTGTFETSRGRVALKTGLTWQCVEFARRYWMQTLGIRFGDVDTADQIWALDEGERVNDRSRVPFVKDANGAGNRLPEPNDLIIFDKNPSDSLFRNGHVVVVVGVDVERGELAIAEQNFLNEKWRAERFSRKLSFSNRNGAFSVHDPEHPGSVVLGWINPQAP